MKENDELNIRHGRVYQNLFHDAYTRAQLTVCSVTCRQSYTHFLVCLCQLSLHTYCHRRILFHHKY